MTARLGARAPICDTARVTTEPEEPMARLPVCTLVSDRACSSLRTAARAAALTLCVTLVSGPAAAQAPTTPPPAAPPEAPVAAQDKEEPSVQERRLVAYIATGVAVASLATGITFGILAQQQFACISDVLACNKTLNNKIVGEELFDARAEVEQKALIADMAYLFAAASAVVATVGYLRGFVFDQEPAEEGSPP